MLNLLFLNSQKAIGIGARDGQGHGVYLIFVDVTKYTIEQIQRDTIKELVNCNQNLILFAREYDPIEDY